MNTTATAITTRPATEAEIAADAHKPAHKRVVTVETNTDGRATIGRANTIHRATVVTFRGAHGQSVGRQVYVSCGSRQYRNAGGKGQPSVTADRYEVDCAKCLADH